MSNQSPFLGVAVGNALTQNLAEQQARRTEVIRRRMALGEQRDALDMERINAEGAGRRQAVQGVRDEMALAGDMLGQELKTAQIAVERAKANPDPRMREIELQRALLGLEEAKANIRAKNAAAAKDSRPDSGGGADGSSRSRTAMDKQVYDTIDEWTKARGDYNAILSNPDALPADVEKAKQKAIALKGRSDAFRRAYRNQFGVDAPLFIPDTGMFAPKGAAPAKPASTKGWSIKSL
jgi:hypothetical protein